MVNWLKVNLALNPDSDFENDSLKISDYGLTLDTKVRDSRGWIWAIETLLPK